MQNIFSSLKKLQTSAFAPFSNYRVASIIETDKGIFEGVNIELDVLNLGICAERNALFSSITKEMKEIKNIYLLTDSKNGFGTPCGACRQALSQFCNENTKITIFNLNGEYEVHKFFDLLPSMWSKKDLV